MGRARRRCRRCSRFAWRSRGRGAVAAVHRPTGASSGAGLGGRRLLGLLERLLEPGLRHLDVLAARELGSRSFQIVSSGAAMKIDEYAPDAIPTISANAKSFKRGAAEQEQRQRPAAA
jgi:hypothetical protein